MASAAPTGDFGLDVHIDTGFLGVSSAQLLVIVQNLFVAPLWMALVWAVHALIVMLEWCFALDLLGAGTGRGGIGDGLRALQETVTFPWLALVTAVGAVLCAYHGLVRRRVAESLAQALLALALTVTGIWVAANPAGTVGALGRWANEASVGTLAVAARGSPANSRGTLADGFGAVFATAIEVPWCYLEFGDVDWCSSPARLDPRLRSAAQALAQAELKEAGCQTGGTRAAACSSGADAVALEQSARLLRTARNNGAIFLALPPNGPARNAINDTGSLLRAICRSDDATDCKGSAAAAAEFRTNRGTWPRVGGLLLIALGVLGLLLLLGFIALRLLGAALFSLLYLMLAPVVALAPMLGEGGREAFRKWASALLGAVVSKLLFAFLLGVVLAILGLLEHLRALGWWTRWLLVSAFWWGAFLRRRQILQLAGSERRGERMVGRGYVLRRAGATLRTPVAAIERVRSAWERSRGTAHEPARQAPRMPSGSPVRPVAPGPAAADDRVVGARPASAAAGRIEARSASGSRRAPEGARGDRAGRERHGQPARVAFQRDRALSAGNSRRAALLAARANRLDAEASSDRGSRVARRPDAAATAGRDRDALYASFLDRQANLLAGKGRAATSAPRYPALAGLAGYGPREYRQLGDAERHAARRLIDRELVMRKEASSAAARTAPRRSDVTPRAEGQTARGEGTPLIPARFDPGPPEARPAWAGPSESIVMKEALEITARRRRQLREGKR